MVSILLSAVFFLVGDFSSLQPMGGKFAQNNNNNQTKRNHIEIAC